MKEEAMKSTVTTTVKEIRYGDGWISYCNSRSNKYEFRVNGDMKEGGGRIGWVKEVEDKLSEKKYSAGRL